MITQRAPPGIPRKPPTHAHTRLLTDAIPRGRNRGRAPM